MKLRGQINVIGIIGGFISLAMYVALTPAATQLIARGVNATNDSTVRILLPLLWVTVGFGILITIIMYTTATRTQNG